MVSTVTEKKLRRGAQRESTILHLPRPTSLSFLLPSFILLYRGCHSLGTSRDPSFPFPGSWSELLWLFGDRTSGETQMVRFSCHPVCLAETSGSKWRGIYSQTLNIYTHIQMHTQSRMYVWGAFTHIFLIYVVGFDSTLVQRHLNRVQPQIKLHFEPLK